MCTVKNPVYGGSDPDKTPPKVRYPRKFYLLVVPRKHCVTSGKIISRKFYLLVGPRKHCVTSGKIISRKFYIPPSSA